MRHLLHPIHLAAATSLALVSLTGCGSKEPSASASENATAPVVPQSSLSSPAPRPVAAPARKRTGPEVLSTVGLYDREPIRRVEAAEATFTIAPADDLDTLMVDGKPATYAGVDYDGQPAKVSANDGLRLVGVFELPTESVAWAVVIGGTACPGSHVLVPVRRGVALPGLQVPGCDDRGTMRVVGARIVLEAGGATGSYQNGLVKVEGGSPED